MIRYKVVPPSGAGQPFEARVENGTVISNRDGTWKDETRLTPADLAFPEQAFIEWDITPIVDTQDFNPYHDPETGQFASGPSAAAKIYGRGKTPRGPGLYSATTESKRSGKKTSVKHEVWAGSWEEAADIMMDRHREANKLMRSDQIGVTGFQFLGADKKPASPPPKPPNVGSKEWEARQAMQRRVDEQKGYKGD
jgi:hypothetical protein